MSEGINALQARERVREIADPAERIRAIAKVFGENPINTLVVSPDNASRAELNHAIRTELQSNGIVDTENHNLKILVQQQDLTGADRRWAARYAVNDMLRYSRGSNAIGIQRGTYARVVSTNLESNLLTVEAKGGDFVTYDPRRLTGVSIYRETERPFAVGDRLQFTAPDKSIDVANRELGTVGHISKEGQLDVKLESGRRVTLNPLENRHFDHGYAVTSHSSQGLTAERVLINIDSASPPQLLNSRFAYVAVSRASIDAEIFTNDSAGLAHNLAQDAAKTSAIEFSNSQDHAISDSHLGHAT